MSFLESELEDQYKPQLKDEAETLLRAKYRDEIKDIERAYDKTNRELKEVDESLAEVRDKLKAEEDKHAEAKARGDKKRALERMNRLNRIIEKGVSNQERLKTKLATFGVQRKVTEKSLRS